MRLPLELYRNVINFLDSEIDRDTLRACSLTCKALFCESRLRLFYHIDVFPGKRTRRFLHHIRSNSPTNPTFFVRRLSIYEGVKYYHLPHWANHVLPVLAAHLGEVTHLVLDSCQLDIAAQVAIMSGFPKTTTLSMVRSSFETTVQMTRLIMSFPALTSLSCYGTRWTTTTTTAAVGGTDLPLAPSLPRTLTRVTLDSCQAMYFSQLLRSDPESRTVLRTLTIWELCPKNTEGVDMLLKTLGANLEHLQLRDYSQQGVVENDVDLVHNTNLRSILVSYHVNCQQWVFGLLDQIASRYLECVTLQIQLNSVLDLDPVVWTRFEGLFTQQRWPALRKLVITSSGLVKDHPVVVKAIRAHLPVVEGRGILHVS